MIDSLNARLQRPRADPGHALLITAYYTQFRTVVKEG